MADQKWSEWLCLEDPVEAQWCDRCSLPSALRRRFMYTEHHGPKVTRAEIMTLRHCRDCSLAFWEEYYRVNKES